MVLKSKGLNKALADVLKKADAAKGKKIQIGVVDVQHYPNGLPVATIAYIHEYGTERIPARPFFRPTIAAHRKTWADLMRKGFYSAMHGKTDIDGVFNQIGLKAAADIKFTISNISTPPLAPATVKARNRRFSSESKSGNQSTKPLIDTGQLINSINYRITDGVD